jgi:protein SCO1/2
MRRLLVALLTGLALLSTLAYALDRQAALDEANILLLPAPRPLPDVALVDQDGQPFHTAQLVGRWHLLFFGFTSCPDVCPTTLSDMRQLMAKLPEETRRQLRLVMASVDPARDTPARMKTYLGYFDADFHGLTGELTALQALSKAAGLPFVPAQDGGDGYRVKHSANLALIAPDGQLQGFIRAPLKVDALLRWLPRAVTDSQ